MALQPGIILSGSNPDLVNSFAKGQIAGAQQKQFQSKNKLREFLDQSGPDVLAGDQNALNELSRFDPQAALGVQGSKLGLKEREQNLLNAKEAGLRAGRQELRQLSKDQAAKELATLNKAIAMGTQAQTPEQWDSVMKQLGQEQFVGGFDQRNIIVAGALGVKEALELGQGPKPQSPAGKFQADVRAGLVPPGTSGPNGKKEEQIARLMESGMSREAAVGIADGRFAVNIDQLGAATIIDRSTGNIVRPGNTQVAGASQPPAAQNAVQAIPQANSFGDSVDRNFPGSTGIVGLVASIANAGASATGSPLPAAEINNAQNTLNSLNRQTTVLLAGELGGRPSNLSLEQISKTLPEVSAIFSGPEATLSRARETRRVLRSSIEEATTVANGTGRFTAKQVSDARQRLLGLQNVAEQWDAIIGGLSGDIGFEPTGSQQSGVTPSGLTFEIIQ